MYVTGRERKILELLLEGEEMTIKDLAEHLDVSTRTIHRDLKGLDSVLQASELRIERTDHSLLFLEGEVGQKEEMKREILGQSFVDYTSDERQLLLLSKLLETREPLKLVGLASELNVTVVTISNDLDKVEEHVKNFDLELVRKRGYGVEIIGDEKRIREAMSHLIMSHMDEIDFLTLLGNQASAGVVINEIAQQLLGLVNIEGLAKIEEAVREVRTTLSYDFSDDAYIGLVIHLALAVERIRQKETIQIDEEYLNQMKRMKEFTSAVSLREKLERNLDLVIPEAEVAYITGHLMGAKARFDKDYWLEESSLSTAFKAKQLIEFMTKRMSYDFHRSNRLLNDLVVHLKPSIYRLQQNMEIVNPFTDQLESDYPELFRLLEDGIKHVFPDVRFPKDEVAYLVMHFASAIINMEDRKPVKTLVVCSSGVGTAKILSAKLSQQFSAIESIDHGSLFDLKQKNLKEYDLVISTVPLTDSEDYVLVNPILQEKDSQKIASAIRKVQVSSQLEKKQENKEEIQEELTWNALRKSVENTRNYVDAIAEILDGFIVTKASGQDSNEFLHQIIGELAANDIVPYEPRIVHRLLEREKIGGLGIPGSSVALFHTRIERVEHISFTVHLLETPVNLGGMDGGMMEVDTILLMLTPLEPPEESLETLSFLSSLLVEEEACTEALQSKDEETMERYFSRRLHQFFKTKIKGDDDHE
ncbi:BglG family transcription antiterminator [Salimicrobium halophilum]|uniref:Transcriptional antiterminator, BglG family n=1 Tax=Salimicrobium halophilum TaxID=86666 RepID=A0A1G8S3W2_9BACI|nr:BglG family transcription antiterminator [Salimicrobium halophilum]SDJ23919.1 transcriptional antiterminator, BglG family [Salimicrobium halophilum]